MVKTEERDIRKALMMVGIAFLVVGIGLAAFSIQVSHTQEDLLGTWDNLSSSPLGPQSSGPRWAIEIQDRSFFELNFSASGRVRVMIGTPSYDPDLQESNLINLVFDQVGTLFALRVSVNGSGARQVEIHNEETIPVHISGNVVLKKIVTAYETISLYSWLATPVLIGGLVFIVYGALTKSRKVRANKYRAHACAYIRRYRRAVVCLSTAERNIARWTACQSRCALLCR